MKMFARVQNGKIIQGPLGLPENFFSKEEKNREVSSMAVVESGWLPVHDNSLEVDKTKTAVSLDYTIEVLPDKIIKTHKTKPFPQEFIDAFNKLAGIKENE